MGPTAVPQHLQLADALLLSWNHAQFTLPLELLLLASQACNLQQKQIPDMFSSSYMAASQALSEILEGLLKALLQ